jgi:hypothetical protein
MGGSQGDRNLHEAERMKSGLAVLVIAGILWATGCQGTAPGPVEDSPEMAAPAEKYKSKLSFSELGLARGENYLGDAIYYVQGKVTNGGDRAVQRVEIVFKFMDSQNREVFRENRRALDYKGGGKLAPQQTSEFQVAFERVPDNWNYSLPEVEVSKVVFR